MTSSEDLYLILQVRRTASGGEIKRAFRKLARRYHPDINPGDRQAEERFKRITQAYDILSDPLKRQFYDINGFYTDGVLDPHEGDVRWRFSFQGFDFSRSSHSEFSDIFGHVFGRRAQRREPERGQDLEHQVSISFDESIRGRRAKGSVLRQKGRSTCKGARPAPGSREGAGVWGAGNGKRIPTQ